MPAQDNI